MTKLQIENKLKEVLKKFEILYSYIGGSFNTDFFSTNSDIDLIIIWQKTPSLTTRQEIIDSLTFTLALNKTWTYLDSDSASPRDAFMSNNFRKIEIYHHGLSSLIGILENIDSHEGLQFSIAHSVSVFENEELEAFIKSYSNSSYSKSDLLFEILEATKETSENNSELIKRIIKLFALSKLNGVPSQKHQFKLIQEIPNSFILQKDPVNWIAENKKILLSWANAYPKEKISVSEDTLVEKSSGKMNEYIFKRIQMQKERLSKYLSWPKYINSMDDQNMFTVDATTQWEVGKAFHFQIYKKDVFAGAISIHSFKPEDRSYQFGYWLDEKFEGQGLIHTSLQQLIKEMESLGWKTPIIRVKRENSRSYNVGARLNMKVLYI